jgi:hypothetical protein
MKQIVLICCLLNGLQHNPKAQYHDHIHSLDDNYRMAALYRYDRKKNRDLRPTDYRDPKKFKSIGKGFGNVFYDWSDS